jgi:glycosyltransferase involved in cell wall biosynthesis
MASGLPCVVAPFAGIPDEGEEFGSDGKHYVRSSHDPEVMAADMLDLIRAPEKAVSIGRAARQRMEQTQQMEKTLDLLAEYYRSALGRA